jgi:hypothetical protein
MTTNTVIEVQQFTADEFNTYFDHEMFEAFSLWYEDLEEAGVENLYVAYDGDKIIGFQTVNADNRCVAIESIEQVKGIGSALVEASGCYKPEKNECPEFWEKMAEIYN